MLYATAYGIISCESPVPFRLHCVIVPIDPFLFTIPRSELLRCTPVRLLCGFRLRSVRAHFEQAPFGFVLVCGERGLEGQEREGL